MISFLCYFLFGTRIFYRNPSLVYFFIWIASALHHFLETDSVHVKCTEISQIFRPCFIIIPLFLEVADTLMKVSASLGAAMSPSSMRSHETNEISSFSLSMAVPMLWSIFTAIVVVKDKLCVDFILSIRLHNFFSFSAKTVPGKETVVSEFLFTTYGVVLIRECVFRLVSLNAFLNSALRRNYQFLLKSDWVSNVRTLTVPSTSKEYFRESRS